MYILMVREREKERESVCITVLCVAVFFKMYVV